MRKSEEDRHLYPEMQYPSPWSLSAANKATDYCSGRSLLYTLLIS